MSTSRVVVALFGLVALMLPSRLSAAKSVAAFTRELTFAPPPAPTRLNARARVECRAGMAPDFAEFWNANFHFSEQTTANYLEAVRGVLADAVRESGLFAREAPGGMATPEVLVKVRFELFDAKVLRGRLTLQVVDPATGRDICRPVGERALGPEMTRDGRGFSYERSQFRARTILGVITEATRNTLQVMLPRLEAALVEPVNDHLDRPAREKAAAALQSAPLAELLVATDPSVELARARNHALIAAKIRQLPGLLQTTGTDGLTDLAVRIEQLMLDLDHAGAMNNDRAQRILAAKGNSRQVDTLRGLAVCYRERIELLKPIATAIKEEIANRSR